MGAVSLKSFEGLDASGARVFAGDLAIDFAKVSALTEASVSLERVLRKAESASMATW